MSPCSWQVVTRESIKEREREQIQKIQQMKARKEREARAQARKQMKKRQEKQVEDENGPARRRSSVAAGLHVHKDDGAGSRRTSDATGARRVSCFREDGAPDFTTHLANVSERT